MHHPESIEMFVRSLHVPQLQRAVSMTRCHHRQNYHDGNKVLYFLLPDERLHKGVEGTGPRQCGRPAECAQVSLSLG